MNQGNENPKKDPHKEGSDSPKEKHLQGKRTHPTYTEEKHFNKKSGKGDKGNKQLEELSARNLALEKDLEECQKKLAENEDFTLRLRADFDNYRKRMIEEKDRILANAGEGIFKHFLKIYDSYTKALDVEATDATTQAFLEGFKLIKQEMDKFLEEHKVVISTRTGDDFDPNIHQAIFFEETEKVEKEKVMEIFQNGYLLNGRLLREAMVKVEKPKATKQSSVTEVAEVPEGEDSVKEDETEAGE